MFIRNGIKSILRERGRTALFSLLIILLTVTMILSFSVLLYSNAVMDACDKAYRSIALVEYMGAEYPNADVPDADARVAAKVLTEDTILSIPGVTGWNGGNTKFATAEGYVRRHGTIPYRNKSVIVVSNVSDPIQQWVSFDTHNNPIVEAGTITYYTCTLKSAIYSQKGREGTYIDILTEDIGFVPEKGKSYVLNGSFVNTSGTLKQVGCFPKNGFDVFQVESFISTDELPYAEYTTEKDIADTFYGAAEQYRIMNNYIRVVPCGDVNDINEFHQHELQLIEGEMPDPEIPYSCVISNDLATQLDLKPGDTFSMNELIGTAEDRYNLSPNGEMQSYTVSGIANDSTDYIGIVWAIAENADTPLFGYLLGTAALDNEEAENAVEKLRELAPEKVRVTLLDQGYGNAVQVFRDVENTAKNILLICSVGIFAILMLFAFLFVGRQHITVKIMVSMGTPSRKTALWFLSGTLVICAFSTILGTLLGMLLQPEALRRIALLATPESDSFLWYSETSIGIMKQMVFDPQIPMWPNLLVIPVIVLIAMLFCLWFLRMARLSGTNKRGKSKVRIPRGKSSNLKLGGFGFASLSIRRSGLRSLVVPFISLVLTVIVLFLGGVYQGWQKKLDDASKNMPIDGMVVSSNGRQYSDLFVTVYNFRTLLDTEGVEDISVSYGYRYWLPEDEPGFSYGPYGRAHRLEWIAHQPKLVALNSLSAAKEFYNADLTITWLDGWDETVLLQSDFTPLRKRSDKFAESKHIPIVCSTTFLEEHDMVLGDTFSCLVQVEHTGYTLKEIPLNLQIIGSYIQQGSQSQIFAPLACHVPVSLLNRDADASLIEEWSRFSFQTCRFQLSSAGELDVIRQTLQEQGFSTVRKISSNRTTLLLRDAAYLRLVENMERNIAMGKILFPVISLLIVFLGFIISWLMIFARRREFALMRGFGVKKWRVFSTFFLEQALLCILGCLIGCVLFFTLYADGVAQPIAVVAYLLCYLLGATVSILIIGRTNLMELLTIRE